MRGLADRLGTPTALYAAFTYTIYSLRHLVNSTVAFGLLIGATAYYGQLLVTAIYYEHKLSRLGKRAPVNWSWSPWNLSFLVGVVWHVTHHRMHEFWWDFFEKRGNSRLPWTIESIIMGGRIVLTADEESEFTERA